MEYDIFGFVHPLTPRKCHCGVILRGEYGYFLRFQITQRFNNLIIPYNPNSWSEEQQEIHDLIKSLHNGGMGYRKIAQYLNEKGIKTARGNSFHHKHHTVRRILVEHQRKQFYHLPRKMESGRLFK